VKLIFQLFVLPKGHGVRLFSCHAYILVERDCKRIGDFAVKVMMSFEANSPRVVDESS
jgi:hypothetical protein